MARTPLTTNDILDKTQTASKFLSLGPQTTQAITDPFLTYGRVVGNYFFQGFTALDELKNISPAYKIQITGAKAMGIGNTIGDTIIVQKVTSAGVVTSIIVLTFTTANQILQGANFSSGVVADWTIDPAAGDFLRVRKTIAGTAVPCQVLVEFMLVP